MKTTIRRTIGSLAAIAAAGTGALVAAPSAHADATNCLNQLAGHVGGPYSTATPLVVAPNGVLPVWAWGLPSACNGAVVSIGISRPDASGFRSRLAPLDPLSGSANFYRTKFAMKPGDVGVWMARQVAVKDRAGRIAVRSFTSANSPYKVTVKRASVLTTRQSGTLRLGSSGRAAVNGHLKAYNSQGGISPLAPGQRVLLQVRPRGSATYTTVSNVGTAESGWYAHNPRLSGYRGADVRLAYHSPYQTIASDFTYVGRVA